MTDVRISVATWQVTDVRISVARLGKKFVVY